MSDRRPLTLRADLVPARVQEMPPGDLIPADMLANALQVVLAGLVANNNAGITAGDTVLQALGKLQAQTNKRLTDAPEDGKNYARVSGGWGALGTLASEDYATTPFINLMSDSGRGTAKANPLALQVGAYSQTEIAKWFGPYNGSALSEVGKFIHDNATAGGSAGPLTQTTTALLAAMGRSGDFARYGTEFYISGLLSGGGGSGSVLDGGRPRYLATILAPNVRSIFSSGGWSTMTAWMRVMDKTSALVGSYSRVFKNNVLQAGAARITPADGWVHLCVQFQTDMGYNNSFPYIHAEPGQTIHIALPAFFHGKVISGIHKAPFSTINELLGVGV